MSSHIGIYRYNDIFYTGTKMQPDTLNVFVKMGDKDSLDVCQMQASANCLDYIPVASSLLAIPRIVNAVKTFFSEASQATLQANDPHLMGCWNAIKNLIRAFVAFAPIIGNITLIIFDSVKNAISYSHLTKSLANQQNIVGIALDDEVIFTVDAELFQRHLSIANSQSSNPEHYLVVLKELCTTLLSRRSEIGSQENMTDIFQRLGSRLNSSIPVSQSV